MWNIIQNYYVSYLINGFVLFSASFLNLIIQRPSHKLVTTSTCKVTLLETVSITTMSL